MLGLLEVVGFWVYSSHKKLHHSTNWHGQNITGYANSTVLVEVVLAFSMMGMAACIAILAIVVVCSRIDRPKRSVENPLSDTYQAQHATFKNSQSPLCDMRSHKLSAGLLNPMSSSPA